MSFPNAKAGTDISVHVHIDAWPPCGISGALGLMQFMIILDIAKPPVTGASVGTFKVKVSLLPYCYFVACCMFFTVYDHLCMHMRHIC